MDFYDDLFNFSGAVNLSDFNQWALGSGTDPAVYALDPSEWGGVFLEGEPFNNALYDPFSPSYNPNLDFAGGIFAPTGEFAPYGDAGYNLFGDPTPGQIVQNTAGGGGGAAGGGGGGAPGNGGAAGGGAGGASNMGGGIGSAFSSLLRGLTSNPAALAALLGGAGLAAGSLAQGTETMSVPPRTDSLTPQEQAIMERLLQPRGNIDIGAADQALLDRIAGPRSSYQPTAQEQAWLDRLTAPLSDDPMAQAAREAERRKLDDHFRAALGSGYDTSTPYFQAKETLERRLASQTRDEQLAERPFMVQGLNQLANIINAERQAPATALANRTAIIGQERAVPANALTSLAGINTGSRDLAFRVGATNTLARNQANQSLGQLGGQLIGLGLAPYLFGPRQQTPTPGTGGTDGIWWG